ncbi:glycosyltransferase family 4 protein [Anaerocolumna xylanovorans]|uniref:Glycosyltransferase involved in cell wall bisynthesis n=1 Tax=Anaerocolumna xylanovorans DSM 12503 TaxID=1121345 RepID=A0A1M7Y809_9FIRM|nr:glycosyltransferase [Anaerocolumna xylanovorans]SHO48763.1 Glycosyltransferase involved in cell wall bisynthesis [Anaerocolumna xylanovorans DSM 12503]
MTIYNICPYIYYRNEQLLKDTCLVPYTFHKLYGYRVVLVTAKKEEYSYLEMLPGLELDIQPAAVNMEEWTKQCCTYIEKNYQSIDILFCFGSYSIYTEIVPLYKKLRKDGKVILKLDASPDWVDKIPVNREDYKSLYENCTVITCESKRIKRLLSRKWPYQIDYLTNGFLRLDDSCEESREIDYREKENIILTVGRIGSYHKANWVLLEAFAMCADCLKEWKVKLVGSIEPEFESYIKEYFVKFPDLRNRIIFTGKIADKHLLDKEYRAARIFALTSVSEGGSPNVFVEAAKRGCYIVCSDIAASEEMTNGGMCGKVFEINDVAGLSNILLEICNTDFEIVLKNNSREIVKYCERFFNYEVSMKKIMHLLESNESEVNYE